MGVLLDRTFEVYHTASYPALNRALGYKSYYKAILTESLMMVRKVLLKRMQNWVRQLAEKLWQPSVEEESCKKTHHRINSFLCSIWLGFHSQNPLTSAECARSLLH